MERFNLELAPRIPAVGQPSLLVFAPQRPQLECLRGRYTSTHLWPWKIACKPTRIAAFQVPKAPSYNSGLFTPFENLSALSSTNHARLTPLLPASQRPCRVVQDDGEIKLKYHPKSWNEFERILFVDQPVGVGFSYAEHGERVVSRFLVLLVSANNL
jgi:hypothetical protein